MLQQTPLTVTAAIPCDVTFPPEVALVCVILLTMSVVSTGTCEVGAGLLFSSVFLEQLASTNNTPIIASRYIQMLVFVFIVDEFSGKDMFLL